MIRNITETIRQLEASLALLKHQVHLLQTTTSTPKPDVLNGWADWYRNDPEKLWADKLYQEYRKENPASMLTFRAFNKALEAVGFIKFKNQERIPGLYHKVYFLAPQDEPAGT